MQILLQTDASLKKYKGKNFQSYGFVAHHGGAAYEGCGAMLAQTNSSSSAEAHAVLAGLNAILTRFDHNVPRSYIRWLCDNQPLVMAFNREAKTKSADLIDVMSRIRAVLDTQPITLDVKWVPRTQNKESDQLSRKAMNLLTGQHFLWPAAESNWIRFT